MSSTVESSKVLAAIGALLLFLSFTPVLGIIGIILLLIGMKGLSEYYRDEAIYREALRGLVYGIIGLIAVSVLSGLGFLGGFFGGLFSAFTLGNIAAIIGTIIVFIVVVIVAFVFLLLMALNFRRAFNALAERSGEHLFRTAGTLLFWGAALTIVAGLGLILVWIAFLLAAIAFFQMRVATPTQPYSYSPPPPSTPPPQPMPQATRFCPNCGAPIQPDAMFCPNCGKPLPAA